MKFHSGWSSKSTKCGTKNSDLHGRDLSLYHVVSCAFEKHVPTNIPAPKTTGLRGSNVWHKSGIIKDYGFNPKHYHTNTHKRITAQFHPNLRLPCLIGKKKGQEEKNIHATKTSQRISNVLRTHRHIISILGESKITWMITNKEI